MSHRVPHLKAHEERLFSELVVHPRADDLAEHVIFSYPWREPNRPLAEWDGPRSWHIDQLDSISQHIENNRTRVELGLPPKIYQAAICSGRGPGKSALASWLIRWMATTRIGSTVIVTANTQTQLETKTWAELGKWQGMAINAHWFDKGALSLVPQEWYKTALQKQLGIDCGYYYAKAMMWREEDPDAFAGAHSQVGMMVIIDEASGIPKNIWSVIEGYFTDLTMDRYFIVLSNGRKASGPFYECFNKDRANWRRLSLDSRTVEKIDVDKLNAIVEKYGEDSYEARVEVRGLFPLEGDNKIIGRLQAEDAVSRELFEDISAPLILGVDPARYGRNKTVGWFRRGRDARSIPPVVLSGMDTMQVVNALIPHIQEHDPDLIVVDETGLGGGVKDRLKELGYAVIGVNFGSNAEVKRYKNKRTELWFRGREWVKGGCIPNDPDLLDDLSAPWYSVLDSGGQLIMCSKDDLEKEGYDSPDRGDALMLTLEPKYAHARLRTSRGTKLQRADEVITVKPRYCKGLDYDLFKR